MAGNTKSGAVIAGEASESDDDNENTTGVTSVKKEEQVNLKTSPLVYIKD
jgi:Biogenesis of lysosome-related organelles complex 1 subunit 3